MRSSLVHRCVLTAFVLLTSCATLVPPPDRPAPEMAQALGAWGRVLAKYVDKEGRVNFDGVAKAPQDLETMVTWVSTVGPKTRPEAFKEKGAVLAYHLNAYNALAMYGVIQAGIPSDFDGFFKRLSFFFRRKYLVAGDQLSLYSYENELVRPMKEPRVHFALNCMSVGCPRLPQVPYEASRLEKQLEEGASEFFNKDQYLQVNKDSRIVRISENLKFYTEDFVNERVGPSLIAYVNRYKKGEKVPEDYKVEFLKYDWTVNRQPQGVSH